MCEPDKRILCDFSVLRSSLRWERLTRSVSSNLSSNMLSVKFSLHVKFLHVSLTFVLEILRIRLHSDENSCNRFIQMSFNFSHTPKTNIFNFFSQSRQIIKF